uniref:Uncharacterized protein n=1 Tax=Glossina palpalis gambiensis TaxID=67801 RepID=A0A1B0BS86_9MUSC
MKIFFLLVVFIVYCTAKPTLTTSSNGGLQRPSPIEPTVSTDTKLKESEEKSKSGVLPHGYEHHVSKRDHKPEHTETAPGKPSVALEKSVVRIAPKQENPVLLGKPIEQKPQHKRDVPVPLVPKYHHSEESTKGEKIDGKEQDTKKDVSVKNHEHKHKRDVQVEDLTGVIYEKPKGNEEKTSTTELSIISPKPATGPVAEHKN